MAKSREQIMSQINKLLALGESDNENEAASAIAMAQSLMDRHKIEAAQLSEADQSEPEEEVMDWEDPLDKTWDHWRRNLAGAIARANGCFIFIATQADRSITHTKIIGRATNVSTVRYLFGYCKNEIDRLSARKRGNGRGWKNNYRLGCVDAIETAIKLEQDALRSEMRAGAGSELMVINNAIAKVDNECKEVRAWADRKYNFGKGSRSTAARNAGARAQGRTDGKGIYPGGGGSKKLGGGVRRIG
jgi:hypothetical protein